MFHTHPTDPNRRRRRLVPVLTGLATLLLLSTASPAQQGAQEPEVIAVARGGSALLHVPAELRRVAVADSSIANPVVLSPREILINGREVGGTTMIVWDAADLPRTYTVEVTYDVEALNRVYATIFPGEAIEAIASGSVIVLSGTVSGGEVARRVVEIARATGATVIENFACIRPSVTC